MSVNLTKKQKNALSKGKNVRVKHSQLMENGEHELKLSQEDMKRHRHALKHQKGMTIKPHHILGGASSFKSVMKGVKRGAKQLGRELLKHNRKYVDKGLKGLREVGEKQLEDILTPVIGKDLAQDIVTENSSFLSKKASRQLDKLQSEVDAVLQHPEVGLVKNRDYAYLNPYNIAVAEELPVATAHAIEVMKGQGVKRVVYLKGGSVKSFFRKAGKVLGSVVKSPAVKKILGDLAKQGVSALATSVTGNPMIGEAVGNATAGLTQQGVDALANTTGDAMAGGALSGLRPSAGIRRGRGRPRKSVDGGAMYMSGMRNRGGAMFMSGKGSNVDLPVVAKLKPTDKRFYL